jgi:phage-related protein/predicted XRE-type DNA-binding protein
MTQSARPSRPISWLKAAYKDFADFPEDVRSACLAALTIAAEGSKADIAKPMKGFSSGVFEVALAVRGDAFRVVYDVQLEDDVWVVHAFKKKSKKGRKTPKQEVDLIEHRLRQVKERVREAEKPVEVIRGSGNVFRDFEVPDADAQQLKAILAAEIIKALDREGLTVRAAHAKTGIAAADFSRIRNVNLTRFTIDRLMAIMNRLGARVDVTVRVKRTAPSSQASR